MEEQEKQAWLTALRLLAAAPKTRRRLREKLESKGFPSGAITHALTGLEKQGFLDDRKYARSLLEIFSTLRPLGRKRIVFEMDKRGLPEGLIQDVLKDYSPDAERRNAMELAKSRWNRWQKLEVLKRRKKTYDYLVRRGFDFALVREILEEMEEDMETAS